MTGFRVAALAALVWATPVALTNAGAADAPSPRAPRQYVPYQAPYHTWQGMYFGAFAGYGTGGSNWTDTTGLTTGRFNVGGGTAGATVGYNMQLNNLVVGAETDFGWSGIKGSSSAAVCGTACETATTWLATARGRIGYAFDRLLPYASGGAAFGGVRISDAGGSATATKVGYALGGGLEYAVTSNWSARLDYHYLDLGKTTCGAGCSAGAPFETRFNAHLLRGGVNFRF